MHQITDNGIKNRRQRPEPVERQLKPEMKNMLAHERSRRRLIVESKGQSTTHKSLLHMPAFVVAGLIAMACAAQVEAQCSANELVKLTPSDAGGGGLFGGSVALSGNAGIIGKHLDDNHGPNSGAAYVFRFDGNRWNQEAKLTASIAGAEFGVSVALDGDVAMIGARGTGSNWRGSAYVFRFDGVTWVQEAELIASDADSQDQFGRRVSLSGNIAVVGAIDGGPNDAGAAYVFRFDGTHWNQKAELTASDGVADDFFGDAVSIDGDIIIVGASHHDDDAGNQSGVAYVYHKPPNGWVDATETVKLIPSDAAPGDKFGMPVSINNNVAVIGKVGIGSTCVFRFDGANWNEEAQLPGRSSTSLKGDMLVIGKMLANETGTASVFRFDGTNWIEQAVLSASDGTAGDYFGNAVSLSGDSVLIGAARDDDGGANSGSAYVFRGLSDCNSNGVLDICDIADGTSRDVNVDGVPDECDCPGDLSGDGATGHADLGVLLSNWGCTGGDCAGDLDGDGDTDQGDLGILLSDWGCGT